MEPAEKPLAWYYEIEDPEYGNRYCLTFTDPKDVKGAINIKPLFPKEPS